MIMMIIIIHCFSSRIENNATQILLLLIITQFFVTQLT
jgi:hypothetical protein